MVGSSSEAVSLVEHDSLSLLSESAVVGVAVPNPSSYSFSAASVHACGMLACLPQNLHEIFFYQASSMVRVVRASV